MTKPRIYEVYLVFVNRQICDGCGECVVFCPVNVFDFTHKAYPVRARDCLGCRTCEAVCKANAVIVTEI